MSDDLDLAGIDQRHEPDPAFRAALQRRVAAIVDGREPSDRSTDTRESTTVELAPVPVPSESPRRGRAAWIIVAAASAAAAVAVIAVVTSRSDPTAPADAPGPSVTITRPPASPVATTDGTTPAFDPGPAIGLEDPPEDEIVLANDAGTYRPGTGPTEVTGGRTYVSLRTCNFLSQSCGGPRGWAYVVGSANSPDMHTGLLGIADELVLSALDDRYFVASGPSSPDPQAAAAAWLIDSVTGQRGALTWHDEPATLTSPEQALVLFPDHTQPFFLAPHTRFLPRVVDARDGTIRPLNVPEQATAALVIHQPGSGRIWIGTAPDAGDAGLAYTDDGGASWTDVELPELLRPTSDELSRAANDAGGDELLTVAAAGDHVAVAAALCAEGCVDPRLFTSANAGETWDIIPRDPGSNVRELFVLDERLVYALNADPFLTGLLVSTSTADWTQMEVVEGYTDSETHDRADFGIGQRGIASLYRFEKEPPSIFSTDLTDWWPIPNLANKPGN